MATLANINIPVVNPSAEPTDNAMAAAGDEFAAQFGARYLLRFANGSATPGNVVLDDPVSATPTGATAFNADVTVAVPAGEVRAILVDANRFRDADGNINWTYSADMTNAASRVEIYRV